MKTKLILSRSRNDGYNYQKNNTYNNSNIEYKLDLILNKLERLFKYQNR